MVPKNNERTYKLTQAKLNESETKKTTGRLTLLRVFIHQTEQQIIHNNDAYIYSVFPQSSNVQKFFHQCKYWLKVIKPV